MRTLGNEAVLFALFLKILRKVSIWGFEVPTLGDETVFGVITLDSCAVVLKYSFLASGLLKCTLGTGVVFDICTGGGTSVDFLPRSDATLLNASFTLSPLKMVCKLFFEGCRRM